ncbi:MAG: DUF167 domain-containing protein [Pirellulaceae bacterium]|mgnify:CR=1 FL=1|nr:DUF167 domain-containing protein [Pirellulaceae bacterium]
MIRFEPHGEGTVLPVRAHAGSKHNEIREPQDGSLRVCITQAPEKGKANKAIIELLSKGLSLRKSQIELVSGETSRQKRFLVRDTTLPELAAKIQAVLDAAAK